MNATVDLQRLVRESRVDRLICLLVKPSGLPFADLALDLSDGTAVVWMTNGEVRTVAP